MKTDFPSDVDLEKRVLSAMMMKNGEIVPAVAEFLNAKDFYRPEHRIIFDAILDVFNAGEPFNFVHVVEMLKSKGVFEKRITNLQYLMMLVAEEHTTAYARGFAKTLKEYSSKRQIIELCKLTAEKARRPDVTVEEITADVENFLTKSADTRSAPDSACSLAKATYERALERSEISGLTGVTTGLYDLNKVTNGLQRGELILLAARPSMGKTALALNIAQNAARVGNVVIVFSLEMSKSQIGLRLLSSTSGVEASKISTGKGFSDRDKGDLIYGLELLEKSPLYVDDTSGLNISAMRMQLRTFKKEHGLDLIVVDYLQLMSGNGENRVQEISGISRGLKSLAKEFNVPVLALSQLSRNVEMRAEKRPQLSDLRDSGSLEQDADVVMFLYRDEYYYRDEPENENIAELIIAKNRNGATASRRLHFNKETMLFSDLLRDTSREVSA